jgi:anti-sigma-K factor RskA
LCAICRSLAIEFQTVADLLPDALPDRSALPALKQQILARAAKSAAQTRQVERVQRRTTLLRFGFQPLALIAVLLLAVLGLVGWNIALQFGRGELSTEQRAALAAVAAGGRVVLLPGTDAAPTAIGRLVQEPGEGRAYLIVRDLPTIRADQEYQVWRITDSGPSGAGTFVLKDGRDQVIMLPVDFSDAAAIGVSIEPLGGSVSPTGAIVLLGKP